MHRATTSLPAPVSPVMRTFAVQRAARSMSWRNESIVRLPPSKGTDASGAEGFTSIQHLLSWFPVRAASASGAESIDHLPTAVAHEFLTATPPTRTNQVAARLQAEINSRADVRDVFLEELTVGRRTFVQFDQDHDETNGMTLGRRTRQFDPEESAHRLSPVVLFGRFQVDAADQLHQVRATAAKFGARVQQPRLHGVRIPPEQMFAAAVQAQRPDFL